MWLGKQRTPAAAITVLLALAAPFAATSVPNAEAKAKSCGVKKLGGDVEARVYVDKGNVSCQLATSTLRHADIRTTRKGWTCYRGNSHAEGTPGGIGCERKKGRDVVSAVYVAD